MVIGGATTAGQSPQDRAAWDALDEETRARVLSAMDPKDFVIATTPDGRQDWARCDQTLKTAATYRAP